jgi:hypothetical protein
MARKDRRFTAEDIARLYCRNITPAQQNHAQTLMQYCEQFEDDVDLTVNLLRYLATIVDDTGLIGARFVAFALEALAIACDQDFSEEQIQEYLDFDAMTGGSFGS